MTTVSKFPPRYYVPSQSPWPILLAASLGCLFVGIVHLLHGSTGGWIWFLIGSTGMASILYGWFYHVVHESLGGLYSAKMDRSFRISMAWFIFTEVMFFAAFFGALFYTRYFSVPWLGGIGDKASSHLLWEQFQAAWPLLTNPDPRKFVGPHHSMGPWPLPSLNTLILLSSGVTITIAHYALSAKNRLKLAIFLGLTACLGVLFLSIQAYEYYHAYHEMGLTLNSGIYGTTFFMLTGFHGAHVMLGTLMLTIMLGRVCFGHFTPEHHFAFEATAWYWHFVDVVWLLLFILVYWL